MKAEQIESTQHIATQKLVTYYLQQADKAFYVGSSLGRSEAHTYRDRFKLTREDKLLSELIMAGS